MRIALCLSGQPRSYKKAHEYIKRNLLDNHEVDVFIHAWKPASDRMRVYTELCDLYQPKGIIYDSDLPVGVNSDLQVSNASHPANFCTSMFYSIYKSNDLRIKHELETNTRYDFVVRSRFDIALNKNIDFYDLVNGKVYVSKDTEDENALLNDQFAIADSDTMNVYASTFLFLRKRYLEGTQFCGHAMLEANLKHFNVGFERIDIDHPFVDGMFNRGRHSIIREDMNKWVDIKIWGY